MNHRDTLASEQSPKNQNRHSHARTQKMKSPSPRNFFSTPPSKILSPNYLSQGRSSAVFTRVGSTVYPFRGHNIFRVFHRFYLSNLGRLTIRSKHLSRYSRPRPGVAAFISRGERSRRAALPSRPICSLRRTRSHPAPTAPPEGGGSIKDESRMDSGNHWRLVRGKVKK